MTQQTHQDRYYLYVFIRMDLPAYAQRTIQASHAIIEHMKKYPEKFADIPHPRIVLIGVDMFEMQYISHDTNITQPKTGFMDNESLGSNFKGYSAMVVGPYRQDQREEMHGWHTLKPTFQDSVKMLLEWTTMKLKKFLRGT